MALLLIAALEGVEGLGHGGIGGPLVPTAGDLEVFYADIAGYPDEAVLMALNIGLFG